MYSKPRRFKLASQHDRTYSGVPLTDIPEESIFVIPNLVAIWIFSLGSCFRAWWRRTKNNPHDKAIALTLWERKKKSFGYLSHQNFVSMIDPVNIRSVEKGDSLIECMLDNWYAFLFPNWVIVSSSEAHASVPQLRNLFKNWENGEHVHQSNEIES